MFGKQDSNKKKDFFEIFDFEQSLVAPFVPKARIEPPRPARSEKRAVS